MDKNTKMTIAISIAVIAIFFVSLSLMGKSKAKDLGDATNVATSTESTSTDSSKDAYKTNLPKSSEIAANNVSGLSVVDQLADDHVAFSGVNFEDDTWVAVYSDKNGEPSNLIGTGLFFGGITEGVSPVMRPTVSGSKYYVTLIKDNGDRVFSLNDDKPQVGAPIVSFIAK